MSRDVRSRFVAGLAVAVWSTYALIVVGVTQSITGAARVCRAWPTCGRIGSGPLTLDLGIVWAHRLAAAAVGALVIALLIWAWRLVEPRRVRGSLGAVVVGLFVQFGIGAVVATTGVTIADGSVLPIAHLAIALGLLAGLVTALAWTLEARTPTGATPVSQTSDQAPPADPDPGPFPTLRAYVSLTKPKLMWLLCLVAAAAMALAAGPALSVRTVALTLTGGVLSIGAAGTFNHVLERDIDRQMARTAERPLPTDRIPIRNALALGITLAVASVAVFWQVGPLAALLGAVAIAFYAVVYTLVLKPNTVQNTVIGGIAGALPALIGWAAVTDSIGWPAIALGGVIFLWTPAHFYNLAMAHREEYAAADIPMMPVVRGDATTRKHVLGWLGATLIGAALLGWIGDLGSIYAVGTAALAAVFVGAVVASHAQRNRTGAMRAFHASNAFLGVLLLTVVVDALVV